MQMSADSAGSHGLNGTRNERGRSGRLRRSTITPTTTSTNADSVPMFTISSRRPIGVKPATTATIDRDEDRDHPRRAEPRVHLREPDRQERIARHREDDPRRADQQRQHDGGEARDGAGRDERRHPVRAVEDERVREGGRRVESSW